MPAFVVAQLIGMVAAIGVIVVIYPNIGDVAEQMIVPHDDRS